VIYDICGHLGERRYIGYGTQVIYGLIIDRVQIHLCIWQVCDF